MIKQIDAILHKYNNSKIIRIEFCNRVQFEDYYYSIVRRYLIFTRKANNDANIYDRRLSSKCRGSRSTTALRR